MRKKIISLCALITISMLNIQAQEYFSFYQLKDYVPESQSISAAYIPENTVSFAVPLTNFGVGLQNNFRLKDILVEDTQTDLLNIDLDHLLLNIDDVNYSNIDVTAHLFHFGLRTGKNAFSFFINAKASVNRELTRELYDFLANGNSNKIEQTINFSNNKFNASVYHEIGLGYARTFLDERLKLGLNLKFLTGVFHASTEEDSQLTLLTEQGTLNWIMTANNATVNTAGLDLIINDDDYADDALSSYLFSNKNKGVALDIGGSYKFTDKFIFEFSINDIGRIKWKENTINYNIEDNQGTFEGLDLKDLDDVEQALKDELEAIFPSNETQRSFKSKLGVKTYFSASYYLTERNKFSITNFNNHIFGSYKPSYALSYNRTLRKSSFGLLTSFGGNKNKATIGANFAVSLGPVQMYIASDNLFSKIEDTYGADIRFGLNLKFGYKKWRKQLEQEKDEELIEENKDANVHH